MNNPYKVILSMAIANELLTKGYRIVEIKPSTKHRGKAAFVFEVCGNFIADLSEIADARGIKL
ncbi:hypothetical protein M3196_11900 [Fictibacillus nanhaiensis]|uniref:hypothetical protein n=1 Tax=Fictibacillus nanhaiensis TaxID=742169 RepID=UPI00203E72CF|nr:hypothetical protein [Fictibacillus nanhaiensis]MCM3732365.1 hypothetical protein [Fictibacillus nanhaiensis]